MDPHIFGMGVVLQGTGQDYLDTGQWPVVQRKLPGRFTSGQAGSLRGGVCRAAASQTNSYLLTAVVDAAHFNIPVI